jgi:hypothetical protein
MRSHNLFLALLFSAVCVNLSAQTADLSIGMSGPSFLYIDQPVIHAIHVTNDGPDTAEGVVVEFDTPYLIQLDFLIGPPGIATSTGVSGGTFWIPSIPASSTVTVWVHSHAASASGDVGTVWNAQVTSSAHDPAPTNNYTRFNFFAGYPLLIRFSPSDVTLGASQLLHYSISVENGGATDPGTLKIQQNLPPGFRIVSANGDPSSMRCQVTDQLVCQGPFGPHSLTTIRITALPDPGIYPIEAYIFFGSTEWIANAQFSVSPFPRHRAAGH